MKEAMVSFLKHNLTSTSIVKAFMFGSLARDNSNPKDCDLFVITNQTPYDEGWSSFVDHVNTLENIFKDRFNLKLHVTINTEQEFSQESLLKKRILRTNTIDII